MTSDKQALVEVDLPLPRVSSGKVRELFDLASLGNLMLFIATDRVSAFDVVMAQGIPDKGRVLTGMSLFWFDFLAGVCPNHLMGTELPEELAPYAGELSGRSIVVRRLEMLPVEFVVRGYLAGSGWKDYRASGSVSGIALPRGMVEADRLPEPVFTPSTKAHTGHDENISEDEAAALCGPDLLKRAKEFSLEIYRRATDYAFERGIILADTKFEFGVSSGDVVLADEVLTPDSSRFWPADRWEPGMSPPSFDKQYLRDWLEGERWNKEPPPPALPTEVIVQTRSRYVEAYERITGRPFGEYLAGDGR